MENNSVCQSRKSGNILFSAFLIEKNAAKKISFIAVFTALSAITNMLLEIKIFDVQFSVTIVVSVITGISLGPICGFAACMLGDFIGYIVNSWGYLYFIWVGFSTGFTAFISGIIFTFIKGKDIRKLLLKTGIVCVLHLFICTIGISSTGFYFYNKTMGFSQALLEYVSRVFGGNVNYPVYVLYRLFIKGQIFNSLFNYAVLFVSVCLCRRNDGVLKYL